MGAHLTEPIRIGIVGAGNRGRNHAARYDRIPGAEIVAVADVDEPKAEALAERYAAESYPTHGAMLDATDLDAVNVCVHATIHADIAVDALEAGTAVFCEKPMAGDYADARRMADAADRTGNRLAVQNQLLYTKETLAAKALADAGALGDVYHATAARSPGLAFGGDGDPEAVPLGARRRGTPYVDGYGTPAFVSEESAGGGVVLDLGSYTVGQLLYLLGSAASSGGGPSAGESSTGGSSALEIPRVERVRAETFRTVPDRFETGSEYQRRIEETGYDVEDVAVAFVTLADGAVLSVRTSWSRYMEDESSALVGTQGGVRLDPFEYFATVGDVEMRASADLEEYLFRQQYLRGERGRAAYDAGLWADPLYHWVTDLLGHSEAPPTADIALESMVVTDGIYRSAELGREVTREEIVEAEETE
ncbi:Gfo/Idh/MocA family oxidoreductase [Halorussus limi]|uniref:Gfo/Idh/MocA family oxidoreductase n=1 Tax=Halorussus limi TaxID=2938695 RepID=A0A8U0HWW8_9EURY|nr:Gfo/Idh/MocA family oxidoreductase [Halorussus limi]UPV75417.1 Gfo/Idh/MocA family oxidoreductase [Halorussus limi]